MRLSIIIPTLNEAKHIEGALSSVAREFSGEIKIVDGGSHDETVQRAEELGVEVLHGPLGLAAQCNLGARASLGDVFLFLSADCVLLSGWYCALEEALEDSSVVGGGYKLRLDSADVGARFVEWGGNFRSRYRDLALSDQALFARKTCFEAVGGFREPSRIPHALLSVELQRLGKMKILTHPVLSSARKWSSQGYLKTVYQHAQTFRHFVKHELEGHA